MPFYLAFFIITSNPDSKYDPGNDPLAAAPLIIFLLRYVFTVIP